MGSGIEELGVYLCNRLSFAEVAKLIERITGERSVCEQTLCNWIREKAQEEEEEEERDELERGGQPRAGATLKVVELNGEWDELWAEAGVAA